MLDEPAFLIRPARPEDAEALSSLAIRSKAHWGYSADWVEQWRPELTIAPDYLRRHSGFVVVENDEIVGMCALEVKPDRVGLLEHIWVAPESQGRGIGRALVQHALRRAADAGLTRVDLVADPHAESFYLHLGARRTGEVPAPMPRAPERTLPCLQFDLRGTPGYRPDTPRPDAS